MLCAPRTPGGRRGLRKSKAACRGPLPLFVPARKKVVVVVVVLVLVVAAAAAVVVDGDDVALGCHFGNRKMEV